MKRLISLLLVICLCLAALPCAALAANVNISPNEQVFIVDCSMSVEDALSAAYENLTPEAKDIFNRVIAENAELVEYHRDNIDSNYCTDLDKNTVGTYSAMSSAAAIIQDGLRNMNLPAQVQEALNMLSSGIVAALADGPLVAGDIYALAVSLYTAVVIAVYLDEIMALWDDIVALFKRAYATIETSVADSMAYVKDDIADEIALPDTAAVVINAQSRTVRVEDRYYVCSIEITRFAPTQDRFYPAMISETLWVCPTYISFKAARLIMQINNARLGVLTRFRGVAQKLCGTLGVPEFHSNEEHARAGYLPHYHYKRNNVKFPTHAWFIA